MLLDLSPLRRHRDYRLLYIGQTVSLLGSMLTFVAAPWQIFRLTGSSLWVGALGAAEVAALVVMGFGGGVLADARDRRTTLIASEVGLALLALVLAANAARAAPSAALVFAVAVVASGIHALHRPALESLAPSLVEGDEMLAIAALGSFKFNVAAIGGPALAGLVLARSGAAATYALDALSFLVSVVCLSRMGHMGRTRETPSSKRTTDERLSEQTSQVSQTSLLESIRYARRHPELLATCAIDVLPVALAMPTALYPALSTRWGGATAVGWLYAAMAIGGLAVVAVSGSMKRVERHGAAVIGAALVWGVAIVGFGLAEELGAAVLWLALAGGAATAGSLFRVTIWNHTIPDRLRGRLSALHLVGFTVGPLIGSARAGVLASWIGERATIVGGGLACIACVAVCVPVWPSLVRYRRPA